MLNAIPEVVTSGLKHRGGMIVVVGCAMVINMMRAGYLMPFFWASSPLRSPTSTRLRWGDWYAVMAILYIQLSRNTTARSGCASAGCW